MARGLRIGYARAVRVAADGTTYSIAGQSANTTRALLIPAAQGSYAHTGVAATLSTGGAVVPSQLAATVNSAGTQISISYSVAVTFGAGGQGGNVITMSGGASTLSYSSGVGTSTLVYNLSRVIQSGETGTLAYTQPTNGIEAASGLADLVSFSGRTVTNGSAVNASSPLSSTFTITSSAGGTNVPFALGYAFKQGEVVSGNAANGDATNWQCTILNRWPDNSIKFAILAGRKTLTAGVASTVTLSSGAPATGTTLTTTDLKATGITASIDCGAFGSASWATTDWDSPHATTAAGHVLLQLTYRKQIGSDAHLVGWLEVRYYLGGAVEVLPWVENCNVVPANATKSATYSFTLGGTSRYSGSISLQHHRRTPLIDGTKVSHWLGSDPGLIPTHNVEDLQATGVVPAYMAKTSASSSRVLAQPTSFTPLQQGSHPSVIGSGGYSPSIGLLPEWDVLHLTCGNAVTYRSMIWNGFSAGRYGIHYRAESDSYRPIRLSQNTSLQLSEPNGETPAYSISHQPAFAYLPYLLTGWRYFAEQVQFQAGLNILVKSPGTRENGSGITKSNSAGSVRHAAWTWRTLVHALNVTPDADTTMAGEFRAQLLANVNHYHGRYIAISHNPQGWVEPYEHGDAYDDVQLTPIWFGAPWMQDFMCAVWGYTKDQGTGLDATATAKLDALFTWKAQGIVGRFGFTGATEYLYRDYHVYGIAMSPSNSADWTGGTGPWYADWGAVYNATFSGSVADQMPWPSPGSKVEGDLRNLPVGVAAEFPCAEALPALAYAVKHGVTGAELAKQRLTTTGNWAEFLAQLDVQPVWAVTDRALPRWRRGMAVNEWREISGTNMSSATPVNTVRSTSGSVSGAGFPRFTAYNGLGVYSVRSLLFTLAAGGHGDYYGNEVVTMNLLADAPTWGLVHNGSSGNVVWDTNGAYNGMLTTNPQDLARYTDGLPCSRHTYTHTQTFERHKRLISTGGSISMPGAGFQDTEAYAIDTNTWDALYSYPGAQGGTGPNSAVGNAIIEPTTVKDPRTECIYTFSNSRLHKLTPGASSGATYSFTALSGTGWDGAYPYKAGAAAVDTLRGKIVWTHGHGPNATTQAAIIDVATGLFTGVTSYSGASAAAMAGASAGERPGMVYEPMLDRFLLRGGESGATIYSIHPTTFAVSTLSTTGGSAIPQNTGAPGTSVYNKFQYLPHLRGCVYIPGDALNAWFIRTH